MPGSSGGSSTVQKQTTEPWKGIQPQLGQVASEAQRLYGEGVGPQYYPGSTYVGPTTQEMVGSKAIENAAAHGSGLSQGLLDNQGALQDIISGKDKIHAGQISIGSIGSNVVPGVGENNKYLTPVLDYAAGKASDSVNSAFGGLGRYGAPEHGGTLGREVGNIYATNMRDQMNTDIDRQIQARQQNIANQIQVQGTNIGNVMQAQAGNIANKAGAVGQYASQAPGAEDSRYWDANKMIGVGAAQRGELQTELQSYIDRFNAEQSRPWDQLSLYNNMVSGLGGMGSQQTSSVPKGSAFSGLLGGGLAGAGIGGQFGGGLGAGIGGGLGGLLGLFM